LLLQVAPEPMQTPEPLVSPAQQGKPAWPQVAQVPLLQVVPGAVHIPVLGLGPQHRKPGPPQVPHAPAVHTPTSVPATVQVAPAARQIPETQHPPPLQPLPGQHTWPGSPQVSGAMAASTPPAVLPP
jgi:hypothetical protein